MYVVVVVVVMVVIIVFVVVVVVVQRKTFVSRTSVSFIVLHHGLKPFKPVTRRYSVILAPSLSLKRQPQSLRVQALRTLVSFVRVRGLSRAKWFQIPGGSLYISS